MVYRFRTEVSLFALALLGVAACSGDDPSPTPQIEVTATEAPTPSPTGLPTATPPPAVTPTSPPSPTPSAAETPTAASTPTSPSGPTPTSPLEPTPTPTPEPTPEPNSLFSVQVSWSGASPGASVNVQINDPEGRRGWYFGMAETGAGSAGWYGEDCYLGTGSYELCHPIPLSSLALDQVSSLDDIVEGQTTLFWDGAPLTYYLEANNGDCWVWGHDRIYYEAEGCSRLNADGSPWVRRGECSGMDPADLAPLGGWVALTFDDGPHTINTPLILDTLREHDVPATFFVLGERVADENTWAIVEEIIADPLFAIANHSWDHADLSTLPIRDVFDEIDDTDAIVETFDIEMDFFRFPYGSSTCETADLARDLGHLIAGWHIDTADWCYAAVGQRGVCQTDDYWRVPEAYESDMRGFILDQVSAFDGGVVLLHDIHSYTAEQLEAVILDLKGAGFEFVGLDDIDAFPDLNADTPYDFPWVGEACDTTHDTCWQVEFQSRCEATGAPGQPATAGVCVLPCDRAVGCTDRDGTAPLFCAATDEGGLCLAYAESINDDCQDVPGTLPLEATSYPSGSSTARVCVPWSLGGALE